MNHEHHTWHSAGIDVNTPSYTNKIFNVRQFQRLVDLFSKKLTSINDSTPIVAVAGCGNSGVPLAAALSFNLGIPLITVRKPGEETVGGGPTVTGACGQGKYVIIDDFVSSGGTIQRMMSTIDNASCSRLKPHCILLYAVSGNHGNVFFPGGNLSVPKFGMSDTERDFVVHGDSPCPDVPSAQMNLFDWAEEQKFAAAIQEQQRLVERAGNERRTVQRQYEYGSFKRTYINDDTYLGRAFNMFSSPFNDFAVLRRNITDDVVDSFTKKNNKPPKYVPPKFAVGELPKRGPQIIIMPRTSQRK